MSFRIDDTMEMVDLSHPWGPGTPIWPAGEEPYSRKFQYMEKHNRLTQIFYYFHMHYGTHVDSPSHVIQNGEYTHETDLKKFIGEGVVLDIPRGKWGVIEPEDLEKATPEIREGDIVIINTGSNKYWGHDDRYFKDGPGLSKAAGQWLVDKKIKAFGIDCQALDHPCATYMVEHGVGPFVPRLVEEYKATTGHMPTEDFPDWEPVHDVLLRNGIPGIENVGGDIAKVTGKRCVFTAFPLRWYQGDGSMIRLIAYIDKKDMNDVPDRVYPYGTY